jgi:hypothetical protein
MARLIRTRDWSKTPLGPVAFWPQALRTAVSICLGRAQSKCNLMQSRAASRSGKPPRGRTERRP